MAPLLRMVQAAGLAHPLLVAQSGPTWCSPICSSASLHALAPALARHVAPGGIGVLSGLDADPSTGKVEARYRAPMASSWKSRIVLDGWATLVIIRRSAQHCGRLIASDPRAYKADHVPDLR